MLKNICVFAVLMTSVATTLAARAQDAALPFANDSSEPIEITADALTVKRLNEIAVFTGNVEAVQGEVNLRSDEMTVYYRSAENRGENQNMISKIDVVGHVFLTTPGETAQGDSGVYNVDSKIITLVDNVVLTQKENIVKGNRLVYDLNTGKSQLFSGPAVPGAPNNGRVKGLFVPEKKEGVQ